MSRFQARGPGLWSRRLDAVIQRERTWLDLSILRLYGHPGLRGVFPEFLLNTYHFMRTAIGVMEAARERSIELAPECPVAGRLVPYWTGHIREESGHDDWLLEDMGRLGLDVHELLAAPPDAFVAELIGTLHFWIRHTHPVAAVAYFFFAERNMASGPAVDAMARSAGVDPGHLVAFQRHAVIDVAHGRELEELVDELPLTPRHFALLERAAITTIRQVERKIEYFLGRAEEASLRS